MTLLHLSLTPMRRHYCQIRMEIILLAELACVCLAVALPVAVPPELRAMQQEQELRERCEVLAILIALYMQADVQCGVDQVATIATVIGQTMYFNGALYASEAAPPASSPVSDVQRLADYLSSVLMLAAFKPGGLLQALSDTQVSVCAG